MNIAMTGSSGLIGSALTAALVEQGHRVIRLVRAPVASSPDEAYWDPVKGIADPAVLSGCDAVVHLAGESIASGRWSAVRKERIRDSRVRGTRVLAEAIATAESPPSVFVSASAIGFYGDRAAEALDEQSAPGSGFLAKVCREWESATDPATDAGVRVVCLRIGMVLSASGGALARMLPPFRLGLGGVIGRGGQYVSWINLDDLVGVTGHALANDALVGPVNAVAPHAVTNRKFTKTLGRVLRRPSVLPVPAFVLRAAFGEMAGALLLASTRVVPGKLQETGYQFRHSQLEDALRHLLRR